MSEPSSEALIVATSAGPVGAVLTTAGRSRAAQLFVHGFGAGGRAGVNGVWTRLTERLAGEGIASLRFDHPGRRESIFAPCASAEIRVGLIGELLAWVERRFPDLPVGLTSSCYGSRFALEIASRTPRLTYVALLSPNLFVPLSEGAQALDPPDHLPKSERERSSRLAQLVEPVAAQAPIFASVAPADEPLYRALAAALPSAAQPMTVMAYEATHWQQHADALVAWLTARSRTEAVT